MQLPIYCLEAAMYVKCCVQLCELVYTSNCQSKLRKDSNNPQKVESSLRRWGDEIQVTASL